MTKVAENTTKAQIPKQKILLLIAASLLFWTPVIIFLKIAGEIIEKEPITFDSSFLQWIHAQSTPILDKFFLFITNLGSFETLFIISSVILIYLLFKKYRIKALILFFSVGGAAIANVILKLLFHRSRPTFWHSVISETSYSFPSGHAVMSSAFILSVILITWQTKWRWPVVIIGTALIGLIGLSRIYLGVHYPTDVIAGWSVSLAWVFVVFIITSKLSYMIRRKKSQRN
jgi:undecaprenyl-diphosphatase